MTVSLEWKSYAGRTILRMEKGGRWGREGPLQRPVAFNPMCRSVGRLNLVTSETEKDE
jgi:hypothetical protein